MKRVLYVFACLALVLSLFPQGARAASRPTMTIAGRQQVATPPSPDPAEVPMAEAPTSAAQPNATPPTPAAIPDAARPAGAAGTATTRTDPLPGLLSDGRGQAFHPDDAYPYSSHVYTHSDLLIFAYQDATVLQVANSNGYTIWSGAMNAGGHLALTPGVGVYTVASSKPFSLAVGDQLTDYVWGYYAMDQFGHGASTLLYTYQAAWYDQSYDPHFVVFAYQNNTHVTVKDTTTNTTIWQGTLNAGQHYDNPSINGQYITVSADKPVSALSYTDQGYFVPASNGTFTGQTFYTFVGNSGQWAEFLNLIAYDNTSVTVTDSVTGSYIWSGTLAAGTMHTVSGLNGRFVTVQSSARIAVSVQPAPFLTANYYHSLYSMDSTGTGIGSYFLMPTIAGGRLVVFAYDDNSHVTVLDSLATVAFEGTLSAGQWTYVTSIDTVYTIRSTGQISVVFDWGDHAGASFAPVHYGALRVDVLAPRGETYRHGDTVRALAQVSQLSAPVTGALVEGSFDASGPGDAFRFSMRDDGKGGDDVANDAVYTAEVPLPDASTLPDGPHAVLATARVAQADGTTSSGAGTSNFTVLGSTSNGPDVTVSVQGPNPPSFYAGESVNITAHVAYADGIDRADTAVIARISRPDFSQQSLTLTYAGSGNWTAVYNCNIGGTYLIDVQARPPAGLGAATGYASARIDVMQSHSPLQLTPDSLASPFAHPAVVPIGVTVRANSQATNNATVFAVIQPGSEVVALARTGPGHYVGEYLATTPNSYTANIYASVPFFLSSQTAASFVVSNASQSFATSLSNFANRTQSNLEYVGQTSQDVAQDGDWFLGQVGGDIASTAFDIWSGIDLGFNEAPKVIKSVKLNGLVRGYTPGLDPLNAMKNKSGIDGRAYQSWATRMNRSLRESLLDPQWKGTQFPPYVSPSVFKRASRYYLARYGAMTADELEDKVAELGLGVLTQYVMGLVGATSLEVGIYSYIADDVTEYKQVVGDYRDSTLTNMPPLTQAQEEAYTTDLFRRLGAANQTSYMNYVRNAILFDARSKRDNEPGIVGALCTILLHQALRLLVGVLADGPGVLLVDAAWTLGSLIKDVKDLAQDVQMWNFASQSLIRSGEETYAMYDNAISGLFQVKQGIAPTTPSGQMSSLQEIARTGWCWPVGCEQEVVTRATIYNPGDETVRYRVNACYYGIKNWGLSFFSNCIENVRLDDGSRTQWVEVAGKDSVTVEIVFKDKQGEDMRPPDGTDISYSLFASNGSGTFQVDTDSRKLNPQPLEQTGLFSSSSADLMSGLANRAQSADQVIPHPISLGPRGTGEGTSQRLHIEAVNPFGFPMSATIMQSMPDGVAVSDPGGGYLGTGQLTWRIVIQPHETFAADFAVALPGPPTELVTMPPAQLTTFVAEENATMTYYSAAVELERRLPLQGRATLPPPTGEYLTVPVEVTNYGAGMEQGELTLTLFNSGGTAIASAQESVSVCAGCAQSVSLGISQPVPRGSYGLEVSLAEYGQAQIVASELITWNPPFRVALPSILKNYTATNDLLANGSFEAGRPPTPWVEYSYLGYNLVYSGAGYGGSWGGWLGGADNARDYLEQAFVVPASAGVANFSLHWSITSQEGTSSVFDRLAVKLLNGNGQTIATLLSRDNTSARNAWYLTTVPVNLSAYRGQALRLRLEATTDYSMTTSFYVDDLKLALGASAAATMSEQEDGAFSAEVSR